MKKGYWILSAIVLLGLMVYFAAFRLSFAKMAAMSQAEGAELEWLRQEFGMDDAQFARIRQLHASHDVKCLEYCQALEHSNERLLELMRTHTNVTPEIETALKEAAELRERCRRTTLQHIYQVSLQMEPEAGQRYREMMTARLVTPGLHHQMAVSPGPPQSHDSSNAHGETHLP